MSNSDRVSTSENCPFGKASGATTGSRGTTAASRDSSRAWGLEEAGLPGEAREPTVDARRRVAYTRRMANARIVLLSLLGALLLGRAGVGSRGL